MANIGAAGAGFAGAASSLFEGFAHEAKSDMFKIEAQADLLKGKGAQLEGEAYSKAGDLSRLNLAYAQESTAIQQAQADRAITLGLGGIRAEVGGSGLDEAGSAVDVLRASAQQGALQKEVLAKQGLITEAGYQEQADVYGKMVEASQVAVQGSELAHEEHLKAAEAEDTAATGSYIGAAVKGAFAIGSLFI